MAQDFGEANFLSTIHGNTTLLKCESRTTPNCFFLFKKTNRNVLAMEVLLIILNATVAVS